MATIPQLPDPRPQFEDGSGAIADGAAPRPMPDPGNGMVIPPDDLDIHDGGTPFDDKTFGSPDTYEAMAPAGLVTKAQYKPQPEPPPAQPLDPDVLRMLREATGDDIPTTYVKTQRAQEEDAAAAELTQLMREAGIQPPVAPQPAESGGSDPRVAMLKGLQETVAVVQPFLDDLGTFATQDMSNVVIGGPLRAVRSAFNSLSDFRDWVRQSFGAEVADPDSAGNQDMRQRFEAVFGKAYADHVATTGRTAKIGDEILAPLPDMGTTEDAKSVTGGFLQAVTQFMTGYLAGGAPRTVAGALGKGMLTDFAVFEGAEKNLADLIQSGMPDDLRIPLLDYLTTDEEDPAILGRLKNAATGTLGAVLAEGLIRGVQGIRQYRRAKELAGVETADDLAAVSGRTIDANDMDRAVPETDVGQKVKQMLGGSENDLAIRLDQRLKPVDYEVPDAVVAKALVGDLPKVPPPLPNMTRLYAAVEPGQAVPKVGEFHLSPNAAIDARFPKLDSPANNPAGRGLADEADAARAGAEVYYVDVPVDGMRNMIDPATGQPSRDVFRIRTGVDSTEPARNVPGRPPPLPDVEESTYINWNRIAEGDDVKSLIREMAAGHADEIRIGQRGVRSNAQTIQAAGDENAWNVLLGDRKQALPNAEETLAMRNLWAASGQKLMELARAAQTGDTATLYAFRRMLAIHNTIQQEVLAVRTETARALQQWRIPAGGDREMLRQIEMALEASGGERNAKLIAEGLSLLGDNPAAAETFVRKASQATNMDLVREYWLNSVLSGPKTHIVNLLGNSMVVVNGIADRYMAALVGEVLDPVSGVKFKEANYMLHGMREAMKDMFSYAYRYSRMRATMGRDAANGLPSPFMDAGIDKLEVPRTRAWSAEATGRDPNELTGKAIDAVGSVVNLPGTMLGGADVFFKTINYRMQLHALAARMASEEAERGLIAATDVKKRIADLIADPPENMRMDSINFAMEQTFTNPTGPITGTVKSLRRNLDEFIEKGSGGYIPLPMGTMIIPFANTISNILSYTLAHSPLRGAKFAAAMRAGGAKRDMELAKVAVGTAAMMVAFDLAMDGRITGAGPTGDKGWRQRAAQRRQGWQPYSVMVPTGTILDDGTPEVRFYAYNRLDPVGYYIGLAADLADYARNTNELTDAQFEEVLAAGIFSISQNLEDKAYFTGVAQVFDAIREPERFGPRYFESLTSSFIPNALREVARGMDPEVKQITSLLDALKAKVPYASKDVPERRDFWNRKVEYVSGLGQVWDAASPIMSGTNEKAQPIDTELQRIGWYPVLENRISVGGGKYVTLRNMPEARNRWTELMSATPASELAALAEPTAGDDRTVARYLRTLGEYGDQTLLEVLNDLVTGKSIMSPEYFEQPDADKDRFIEKIIRAYKGVAKHQVIQEFPKITEIAGTIKDRSEKGAQTRYGRQLPEALTSPQLGPAQ